MRRVFLHGSNLVYAAEGCPADGLFGGEVKNIYRLRVHKSFRVIVAAAEGTQAGLIADDRPKGFQPAKIPFAVQP